MRPRPPRPFTPRRAVLVAVIVGSMTAISCEGQGVTPVCAVCGLIGQAVVETQQQQYEARNSCGACPDGMRCNPIHRPARCAPERGQEGDFCGTAYGASYDCEQGFECDRLGYAHTGICRRLPGTGAPCDFGRCGPGLVCGTDERCRTGCAPDCSTLEHCNVLLDPPRCTSDPAMSGEVCGTVHSHFRLECVPPYACVDRGSGGHCELAFGGGPCGPLRNCPLDFVCDETREVCVAGPGAP